MHNDYLMHHGVKGQRWGIRRYQNPDGSLTALGRKKYLNQVNQMFSRDEYGDLERPNGLNERYVNRKYGLNKRDNEGIRKVIDQYDKERGLMAEAEKAELEPEFDEFEDILKESKTGWDSDELGFSVAQIYCINRGVNPIEYSKKVRKAEENYRKNMKKEVGRILGDVADEPIENLKNEDSYIKTAKDFATDTIIRQNLHLWSNYDADNLARTDNKEDADIIKKLVEVQKKRKKKFTGTKKEPIRGIPGQQWAVRREG